ncbi:hypothetical protein MUK42_13796 [Musa troglodytarum]|uniref:Uncharacterized protein n=1 Tax=Musa troglodytarum TaxID=320322 RepID=A0A9E7L7W4_9LILI|nr:hypothetical protein MUK42_13796 [Musa troglodytarum]
MWNERTSSMGSLWLLASNLITALMWRHHSYMVALKVKAPPIGSFAPLHTPIDLVMVLDLSQGMIREKL